MKINPVKSAIAIAISSLLTYGIYTSHEGENKIFLGVGSFIFLILTLVMTIGVSFEFSRTSTNIKYVSGLFFLIALFSNLFYTFIYFSIPSYIIINGILMSLFILLTYSINKAKQ